MARRMDVDSEEEHTPTESLSLRIPAEPNFVDDDPRDEEDEDIEEQMVRLRVNAARTLFHQPRGENDTVNSTRSLYDSDVVYLHIHGRRYAGEYYQPNDEDEQTRLQILDGIYLHLFDQKLTTVPLSNPEKILDIGTGTGEWAMAIGEEYPGADVIGTDIAKIQPSAVPLNVFFEIDNAENEGGWARRDNDCDFVHFRSMSGAFRDWTQIYKETLRHLKPGGWVEVVDFDNFGASDEEGPNRIRSFFSPDSDVAKLIACVDEAALRAGRPRGAEHLQEKLLENLGYADVSVSEKTIPPGKWPEDKELNKIGIHFLVAQLSGLEAHCLRLLTEQAGWDPQEVVRKCREAEETIKALALHPKKGKFLGLKIRILTGRKPDLGDGSSVATLAGTNGLVV